MGMSKGPFEVFDFGLGRILSLSFNIGLFKGAAGFSSPLDLANIEGRDVPAVEALLFMSDF
jgi:hypothetical protein